MFGIAVLAARRANHEVCPGVSAVVWAGRRLRAIGVGGAV